MCQIGFGNDRRSRLLIRPLVYVLRFGLSREQFAPLKLWRFKRFLLLSSLPCVVMIFFQGHVGIVQLARPWRDSCTLNDLSGRRAGDRRPFFLYLLIHLGVGGEMIYYTCKRCVRREGNERTETRGSRCGIADNIGSVIEMLSGNGEEGMQVPNRRPITLLTPRRVRIGRYCKLKHRAPLLPTTRSLSMSRTERLGSTFTLKYPGSKDNHASENHDSFRNQRNRHLPSMWRSVL